MVAQLLNGAIVVHFSRLEHNVLVKPVEFEFFHHYTTMVPILQPFSRPFFVFFSKIPRLECNTTSDWLNHPV